jgi:hypothetical protein
MSAQGLAGIEVELTTHEDIEWERNLEGVLAFLKWAPPTPSSPVIRTDQIGTSMHGRSVGRIKNPLIEYTTANASDK